MIKSSTTDLQRNFKKNTSKSLTNLANTVWVLVVMVVLLILSSNNIYHQFRRSQSERNSLILFYFFFNLVAKMEGFWQLCSSQLPEYSRLRLKTKRVLLTLN